MNLTQLPFTGFAGVDTDTQPFVAAQREDGRLSASTASNVMIDQVARELAKAPGSKGYTTARTATGETIIRLIPYKYPTGRVIYIARTVSGYYQLNTTTMAWSGMNTISGLPGSASNPSESFQVPSYAQIGKHLVIVDGMASYYWDGIGTNLSTSMVFVAPAPREGSEARPKLVAATTGGSLAGPNWYDVRLCFRNSAGAISPPLWAGGVHMPSTAAGTITVSSGYGCAATGTGDGYSGEAGGYLATPVGATHLRVYMRRKSDDALFYQVAEVAVNVAAVNTEITATVTATTTTSPMTTFHGAPGNATVLCEHVGRAFYTGSKGWPIRVWWSEPGEPLRINETSWFDVGELDDPAIGITSFPGPQPMLGILKKGSIWSLAGFSDSTFISGLSRVASNVGCICPHSVIQQNDVAWFCGAQGIFRWPKNDQPQRADIGVHNAYLAAIRGA